MDVGGSGLRLQEVHDGMPSPLRTAPGARIGTGGIDVSALIEAARVFLPAAPDVLVWSMRGLLGLAGPVEVLRAVGTGLGAGRTVVASDGVTSLVGALGELRPGAVLAAGTGAVAFGSDFEEVWRRVDGWGHVLGDRGSGAWIGLAGLQAGLRCLDGVAEDGRPLLDAGREHFGEPQTWPRLVMTRDNVPQLLSGFAPIVTELAAHDPAARRICEMAGGTLAQSLASAARGLDDPALSATGGVLQGLPVREAFEAALAAVGMHVRPARGGSLDGALFLARLLAAQGHLPEHPAYLLVA